MSTHADSTNDWQHPPDLRCSRTFIRTCVDALFLKFILLKKPVIQTGFLQVHLNGQRFIAYWQLQYLFA